MAYRNTQYVPGTGMSIDQTDPDAPVFNSTGGSADNVASVRAATTAALAASTYGNGTAGVGATLTENANGTLAAVDGVTLTVSDRVLVKNQAAALQNGIYVVTSVGSGGSQWVITRSTDADTTDEMDELIASPTEGTTNKLVLFGQQTLDPVIGTDPIVFSTVSGLAVTQATAGTQVKFQIPLWNAIARQLTKGTADFQYQPARKFLITDNVNGTVMIGKSTGLGTSGNAGSVFLGFQAGSGVTSGSGNVFIGQTAGNGETGTTNAVSIGNTAGSGVTSSSNSVLVGFQAGFGSVSIPNTVAIGNNAGGNNSSISNNVFIGQNAGTQSASSNSVNVGLNSGLNDTNTSPSILIGPNTNAGSRNNVIVLGVGTGTTASAAGQMKIDTLVTQFNMRGVNWTMPSAQGAAGTKLTNDGSGVLSWGNGALPHVIFAPATGSTVNLSVNRYNAINPSGAILALTVNFPASPADNDVVEIKYDQGVTTITYSGGTVLGGITSAALGAYTKFTYDAGTTTWY